MFCSVRVYRTPRKRWETPVESPTSLGTNCSCLTPIPVRFGSSTFSSTTNEPKGAQIEPAEESCPSPVTTSLVLEANWISQMETEGQNRTGCAPTGAGGR